MKMKQPFLFVLLAVLGGGCPAHSELPDWPSVPSAASPEILLGGLDDPAGLAVFDGGFALALRGSGDVLFLDANLEETGVLAEGLDAPSRLLSVGEHLVVSTAGSPGLWLVDAVGEASPLWDGEGPVTDLVSDGGTLWFTVSETETTGASLRRLEIDGVGSEVLSDGLSEPGGISLDAGDVYVADFGRGQVLSFDGITGAETLVTSPDEDPRDVVWDDSNLFIAARSDRWPGGGWIYALEAPGGNLEGLSYSPPGLDRLAVDGQYIYWSSSQSITRVPREGGTYELVAGKTRVADFLVLDDSVIWTDRDRGELLAVPMAD